MTDYEDVFRQVKMLVVDRHLGKNLSVVDSEKQIFLCRLSGPLSWELEGLCTVVFTEAQDIIRPRMK